MKNFLALLVAGLIGGVATIGGVKYLDNRQSNSEEVVVNNAGPKLVPAIRDLK